MSLRLVPRLLAFAFAGLLGLLAGALPALPASWLGRALELGSGGRALLLETTGTVWHGGGRPAFRSGGNTDDERISAFPGAVEWRFAGLSFGPLRLKLELAGERVFSNPVLLELGATGPLALSPGRMALPVEALEGIGAPFNTLRLGGRLEAGWQALAWERGLPQGPISLEWRDARSAVSAVAPLGSYRLDVLPDPNGFALALATLQGPLSLEGNGHWQRGGRFGFNGRASAAADQRAQLQPLMNLLGPSNGDGVALRIGSS
ncbi:type II secretion system protein N [Derxia gummosa]|uniref:Type II secretion system protein N n=1 Tax=Derxia gummosa DSM 723 TaxID=1121388 RepID=A0A8B6X7Q8_9BURK|nr:type II secretion system protein N [Derxia gummosa]